MGPASDADLGGPRHRRCDRHSESQRCDQRHAHRWRLRPTSPFGLRRRGGVRLKGGRRTRAGRLVARRRHPARLLSTGQLAPRTRRARFAGAHFRVGPSRRQRVAQRVPRRSRAALRDGNIWLARASNRRCEKGFQRGPDADADSELQARLFGCRLTDTARSTSSSLAQLQRVRDPERDGRARPCVGARCRRNASSRPRTHRGLPVDGGRSSAVQPGSTQAGSLPGD